MKKYKIELSEQQMRLIADCLEDISRFASGQWELRYTIETMLTGLPFDEQMKRRAESEELLRQVKRILVPELSDNASKGYNGSSPDKFMELAYDFSSDFIKEISKEYSIYKTKHNKIKK